MKRNKRGFTVIELITALTLLTLVIFTFVPIVSYSLAQIATAGQQNAALHDAAGTLEGAQAQILDEITVTSAAAATNDVKVVFQKEGVSDSSGSTVEYGTGTELQPTDTTSMLDDLLSFVGTNTEGSLTLSPSSISMKDYAAGDVIAVTVTAVGFTFRDTSIDSKMKLVDKNGDEVTNKSSASDTIGTAINFSYNASTGKVTFNLNYYTLDPSLAPYRVYYGKYFAYQPIEIIDFDMFDLIVGGADARVAVAEGSTDSSTGQYIWFFEDYSIDYAGDERTINDILWVSATSTKDERFVGVGQDGLYFELTEAAGLTFPILKGSLNGTSSYTTYNDDDEPSTSADLNQAVIADKTAGTIAVAGNLGADGQYTIPTGGTSGSIDVTGIASDGSTAQATVDAYKDFTVYEYERYSGTVTTNYWGSSAERSENTGVLMGSASNSQNGAVAVATGAIDSTTYTLAAGENGRIFYYAGTAVSDATAMVFSRREYSMSYFLASDDYSIYRCTVPSTITSTTSSTVSVTSLAYGDGMFMIGMADGSIYCTDEFLESGSGGTSSITTENPFSSNTTGQTTGDFGYRERTNVGYAINSITYVESVDTWVAVGDNGLILYRKSGDPGQSWTSVSVSVSADLNEVKSIENSLGNVEIFVVGENSTILHVADDKLTGKNNWVQDIVYAYDTQSDSYYSISNLSFNTVARKVTGG